MMKIVVGKMSQNFNWQLINWPIEKNILEDLNIKLEPGLDIEKNIQEEKFI